MLMFEHAKIKADRQKWRHGTPRDSIEEEGSSEGEKILAGGLLQESYCSSDDDIDEEVHSKENILSRVYSSAILDTLALSYLLLTDRHCSIDYELSATQVRRMNQQSHFCRT